VEKTKIFGVQKKLVKKNKIFDVKISRLSFNWGFNWGTTLI